MATRLSLKHVIFLFLLSALAVSLAGMLSYVQWQQRNTHLTIVEDRPMLLASKQITPHSSKVYFLNNTQLGGKDFFSATWLQPVDTFVQFDTSLIKNVESGCFAVFRRNRRRLIMTYDWLDFSVEHLSKWWKTLHVFQEDIPYQFTIRTLKRYMEHVEPVVKSPLQHTIAVIAFQPWNDREQHKNARTLTIHSLAATVASLVQAGFGRVVVVGYNDEDEGIVEDAFRLLRDSNKVISTELAYARATTEEVTSHFTPVNLVKGALTGLQSALKGDMTKTRQRVFLGTAHSKSYWKYVYLTEPDSILNTRPTALAQLQQALEQGMVLMPHRLQPLPHESDVVGLANKKLFVPNKFATVQEVDSLRGNSCCDEDRGDYKPFQKYPRCQTTIFWWQCGFRGKKRKADHSRLKDYQLMRLTRGTGIVNLAANEHGRRCIPSNDACVPFGALQSFTTEPPVVTTTPFDPSSHQVYLLPSKQLEKVDYFSATWLQPVSMFLDMNTNEIVNVEHGVFQVWKQYRDRMRMTLDWFDFSVEHLSKYWKNIGVPNKDPTPFDFTVSSLQQYFETVLPIEDSKSSPLRETIGVIAYQPWRNKSWPDKSKTLTVTSLAATIASLVRAGFGRVVIVSHDKETSTENEENAEWVQEAFHLLLSSSKKDAVTDKSGSSPLSRIGATEVGYALVTTEEVTSKLTPINVVKGALVGLQLALKGKLDKSRTRDFLGSTHDASYWKYVYLTEPDTILQTRPYALSQLKDALDQGFILTPHRLQPIPHEYDVGAMWRKPKYLPAKGNFSTVIELNPLAGGVCCDKLEGSYKEWRQFGKCGAFWWQCGFNRHQNHSRLEGYQLMRFRPGTGIVSLAGTEHGRRCVPNPSGACVLPGEEPKKQQHQQLRNSLKEKK